jgi:hypothetical protein
LGWVPKAALIAAVLSLGALGYHQHRVAQRTHMAQSLPKVSGMVALSSPEVWEHFEDINRLSRTPPPPDRELLALMK